MASFPAGVGRPLHGATMPAPSLPPVGVLDPSHPHIQQKIWPDIMAALWEGVSLPYIETLLYGTGAQDMCLGEANPGPKTSQDHSGSVCKPRKHLLSTAGGPRFSRAPSSYARPYAHGPYAGSFCAHTRNQLPLHSRLLSVSGPATL